MSVTIVYDHFIARGGAENVSLLVRDTLGNARIETAYVDPTIFTEEIQTGKIIAGNFRAVSGPLNSLLLLIFYLIRYRLPESDAALLSGLYSPLCLLRKQKVSTSVIYFHMFPVFLEWTYKELRQRYGAIVAFFAYQVVKLYRALLVRASERASRVFSNSNQAREKFLRIGIKTEVLYPPVTLSGFTSGISKDFFLSTARLEESKRVRMIANAFCQLPDINIVFIGGGSLLVEFQQMYEGFNNIQFLGWVSMQQARDYYSQARCLIYIPENEAFGIAPIEAMAAGKPVIGVAEAGLLETVTDERLGSLIPLPVTTQKLTQVISEFNSRKDTMEEIQFRKEHAAKFDENLFYEEISKAVGMGDEKSPAL